MIEALKCNSLARIKVEARIQTQRKMLIEFRGSGRWNHQRVNSISSRRKQIFLLQAGSFTDCISAWFDVFTYSSRWRGPAIFSDSRLQQLPSSCCWTRGADPIKNALGTGATARALPNIHAPTLHVCLSACRADATLSAERVLKLMQHIVFIAKGSSKRSGFACFSQLTTNHVHERFSLILHKHEQVGSKAQKKRNL